MKRKSELMAQRKKIGETIDRETTQFLNDIGGVISIHNVEAFKIHVRNFMSRARVGLTNILETEQ